VGDLRNAALFRFMSLEVASLKPVDISRKKHVVYYSRTSTGVKDRLMPNAHEKDVIAAIRAALKKNGRPEKVVVFNGENSDRTKLGFQELFDVFRDASVVIGPHGTHLAHMIWMAPTSLTCSQAPVVLEFICTQETKLRACVGMSYWSFLGGAPWLKYNHLFLAKNSTDKEIFIELPELDATLNRILLRPRVAVKFPSTIDATQVLGNRKDPLPMLVESYSARSDVLPFFFHVPKVGHHF